MEVTNLAGGVRLDGATFPTTKHSRLRNMDRNATSYITENELRMYANEVRL